MQQVLIYESKNIELEDGVGLYASECTPFFFSLLLGQRTFEIFGQFSVISEQAMYNLPASASKHLLVVRLTDRPNVHLFIL